MYRTQKRKINLKALPHRNLISILIYNITIITNYITKINCK